MIAIIPAAGKGQRMAPLTAGRAKEMLDVNGKPIVSYAFDEAMAAGVDEIVLISSREKEDQNALFRALDYPKRLVIQPEPTGLASAVFLAGLDRAAIVILPDALYHPGQPAKRIARLLSEGYDLVLFTELVADSEVEKFGIFEPDRNRIIEKPKATETSSRHAIGGRFGFSSAALQLMARSLFEDPQPDLPLTPTINFAIENGLTTTHLEADRSERRYDCGSVAGYKRALREVV
jgi:UTP-glucose-1-phosphate uridylyltransferase